MEDPTEPEIRVLCADDNVIITMAVEAAIEDAPGMTCVGSIHRADDLIETVERMQADVVLLDLSMPGREPLEAMEELVSRRPDVKVIVFSGYDDEGSVGRAVQAGVKGYVSKDGNTDSLIGAIRRIAAGETMIG